MKVLSLIGVLLSAVSVIPAWAETGTVLLRYESALGTLPLHQGWLHEGHCLNSGCPSNPPSWDSQRCHFQGQLANDCTLGHGCGPDTTPPFRTEHYNAPTDPPAVDSCSYTEWIAFDDGQDYLDEPFPVPLPRRNLTFGPGQQETWWGPHVHPAFGAPGFVGAPADHYPVRIATGGGVPDVQTLPAVLGNMRNTGKAAVRGNFTIPPGTTAVTLLARLACGNRKAEYEMVQFRAFGYCLVIGVDGVDGSPSLGEFRWGTTGSTSRNIFPGRTVQVALAKRGVPGPHQGEFFTVRVILRNDGGVRAWLNEDLSSEWVMTIPADSIGSQVRFHPDDQAGVMWLDYARVYEGMVLPGTCGDPVFDVNYDGRVNDLDLLNGLDGFLDCATGPAPASPVYEGLPDKCRCHDVDDDQAVDMIDFGVFQRCLTFGTAPLDPACDD